MPCTCSQLTWRRAHGSCWISWMICQWMCQRHRSRCAFACLSTRVELSRCFLGLRAGLRGTQPCWSEFPDQTALHPVYLMSVVPSASTPTLALGPACANLGCSPAAGWRHAGRACGCGRRRPQGAGRARAHRRRKPRRDRGATRGDCFDSTDKAFSSVESRGMLALSHILHSIM